MIALMFALTALIQPAKVRIFKDWAVACDNGLRCEAVSLNNVDFSLSLQRNAGPEGALTLTIASTEKPSVPIEIRIDHKTVLKARIDDYSAHITGDAARALADKMAQADYLSVTDADGVEFDSISTDGGAAALRYMDDRQGRAGGVTALVAKGSAPASAVRVAPALPVVVAPPLPAHDKAFSAVPLPPGRVRHIRQKTDCGDREDEESLFQGKGHDLGRGQTLVLLYCETGAYNQFFVPIIMSKAGIAVAPFDILPNHGKTGQIPLLVNAEWNKRDGTIRTFAKSRGMGDCGTAETFAWDGRRFRLIEQQAMDECMSSRSWPTTFRAQLRRR